MASYGLYTLLTATGTATGTELTTGNNDQRTFQAVCTGTGSVTATVTIEGSLDKSNWVTITTLSLSGTAPQTLSYEHTSAWTYIRASTSGVTGTGATVNVYVALNRKREERISDSNSLVVDPRDFGAKFDGVTDDSAAIQAAITASGNRLIVFPDKAVTRARFTLNNYTRIEGNGTRVEWPSAAQSIVTIPSQGAIQTIEQSYIRNLNIDGVNTTTGSVGLDVGNHAAFWMENVCVDRCDTGVRVLAGQFDNARGCRIRRCNVGWYHKSTYEAPGPGPGGGNSWSIYDGIFDQNKIAMLVYRDPAGSTPHHSNYLRNCTFMDSEICGLAVFNATHLVVDGGAPEYTGGGSATYDYDGLTIKKSGTYIYNSLIDFENYFIAEGTIDPMFLLESSSLATFRSLTGYGVTSGQLFDCDTTSGVVFDGSYGADGTAGGIIACNAVFSTQQAAMVGSFFPKDTPGFPNIISGSQSLGFSGTEGTASNTTGTDSVYGNYTRVVFAASVGNENSHRVRWTLTTVDTFMAISFCMRSSIDESYSIRFNISPAATPRTIKLKAGVWHRVFWMSNSLPSSAAGSFVLTPLSASGATAEFCKWNAVTGTLTPQLRAYASQMASGVWRAT